MVETQSLQAYSGLKKSFRWRVELAENSQLYNWFNGKITYVELPDPNEETDH